MCKELERLVPATTESVLEKADLLLMTKYATEKNRSLKTQLFVSKSNFEEETAVEKASEKNGFFNDEKSYSGMEKVNFPEDTLFYINQGYPIVQNGENILYADHFILDHRVLATNVPTDVENYKCLSDKVKIIQLFMILKLEILRD